VVLVLVLMTGTVAHRAAAQDTVEIRRSLTMELVRGAIVSRVVVDLHGESEAIRFLYHVACDSGDLSRNLDMVHSLGLRLDALTCGPVVLAGELARLYQPYPRSARSTGWIEDEWFSLDASLHPTSTRAAFVGDQQRCCIGCLERRGTRSVVAWMSIMPGGRETPLATALAAYSMTASDDSRPWLGESGVAEHLAHLTLLTRTEGRSAGGVSGVVAVSCGRDVPPGWMILTGLNVSPRSSRTLGYRGYLVANSPSYRCADGRRVEDAAGAGSVVTVQIEPISVRLAPLVVFTWGDVPAFVTVFDPTSIRWRLLDLEVGIECQGRVRTEATTTLRLETEAGMSTHAMLADVRLVFGPVVAAIACGLLREETRTEHSVSAECTLTERSLTERLSAGAGIRVEMKGQNSGDRSPSRGFEVATGADLRWQCSPATTLLLRIDARVDPMRTRPNRITVNGLVRLTASDIVRARGSTARSESR
jgi:hypothetical protein